MRTILEYHITCASQYGVILVSATVKDVLEDITKTDFFPNLIIASYNQYVCIGSSAVSVPELLEYLDTFTTMVMLNMLTPATWINHHST